MPVSKGGKYAVTTTKSGKKIRLHFSPAGTVDEAKNLHSGKTHTSAEFAADKKKSSKKSR